MKIIPAILLAVSLIGSAVTGFFWHKRSHQAVDAREDATHYDHAVAQWQMVETVDRQNDEQAVSNDELRVQNDEIGVHIAELGGGSMQIARAKLKNDQRMLALSQFSLRIDVQARQLGPRIEQVRAEEGRDSSLNSVVVYRSSAERYEKYTYGCAGVCVLSLLTLAMIRPKTMSEVATA